MYAILYLAFGLEYAKQFKYNYVNCLTISRIKSYIL